MNNDTVHLFDDNDVRTAIVGWPHEWPPWEHIAKVTGRESGATALVKFPEGIDELAATCFMEGDTIDDLYEVVYYTRDSYSGLPEDMGPNVSRGARYLKNKESNQ